MAGLCQRLNNLSWLVVIGYVHDIAVPESIEGLPESKNGVPVIFGSLHCLLQPVTNGFVDDFPNWLAPVEHPALYCQCQQWGWYDKAVQEIARIP